MKKIKVLFFLLISIILTSCRNGTIGGSGNIGYNTPALETFSITFEYYSTKEKEGSFILKSKDIPKYEYNLIRIEEYVFLAISVKDIFEDKRIEVHHECEIFGVNDTINEVPEHTYNSLDDLYIAVYENVDGPWKTIDKINAPAILLNKNEDSSTFVTKLTSFKAILTTE